MLFKKVAEVFERLEETSGRLDMTDLLADLFKKTSKDEIKSLIYLIQGTLSAPYISLEMGMGEKFIMESIASSTGHSKKEVELLYKKKGDLGLVAEELLKKKKQTSLSKRELTLDYVYYSLVRIAKTGGRGSQDLKIKYLADIFNSAEPLEARFIARIVNGSLRFGVGDPTILDALSVSKAGDKSLREELERAFNICSDLGHVAEVFFTNPKKIKKFRVEPFKPLQPALAERLPTPEAIIKKIGKCGVEHKFDGFRLQCHKLGEQVELYSRRLEVMTHMFPDLVEEIKKLKPKEIIFEGEALAFDRKKKRYFSFQKTMHRRRKHGIKKASEELPLNLFVFDILQVDGEDLTEKPLKERRKLLEKYFPSGILKLSEMFIVEKTKKLENIFNEALKENLEGIMAKDLNAPYTAGKRKFAWIKLKKSYGKSVDTVDGVIVGYFLGRGSRARFEFGGLLLAVYNDEKSKFETVAKIGSGFTEDEMVSLEKILSKIKTEKPPADLDYKIKPDFWVKPEYVVEVAFDEITKSPTHTCGLKGEKGYALRFPRMVELREDKSPKQVTTTSEVAEMFWMQKKK
ncbi:ATP-dependent DNA ligase [Candidatus Micrarchaeota archaeon]|nr:ATP-dependent DNA ligase [Candidatus Micrarchaeota archaeon]